MSKGKDSFRISFFETDLRMSMISIVLSTEYSIIER